MAPVEIAAGMIWPVAQQYALIENALAAAEHLSSDRQSTEIAELWARFNAVAAHNPEAAFPQPRDASDIATPGRTTGGSPIPTTGGTPASGRSIRPRHS